MSTNDQMIQSYVVPPIHDTNFDVKSILVFHHFDHPCQILENYQRRNRNYNLFLIFYIRCLGENEGNIQTIHYLFRGPRTFSTGQSITDVRGTLSFICVITNAIVGTNCIDANPRWMTLMDEMCAISMVRTIHIQHIAMIVTFIYILARVSLSKCY